MGRKIIYKVDVDGVQIKNLKEWKLKNPRKIWFDSGFERDCYALLKKAKFNFDFHPETRELVPSFKSWALSKGKGARKIFKSSVRSISYTTDFAVRCNDGTTIFIEAKGFFHPDARLRYKLFQKSLANDEVSVLVFDKGGKGVLKDLRDLITVINEHYGGSSTTGKKVVVTKSKVKL